MFPQCRPTLLIILTVYQLNIRPTRQQWSRWWPRLGLEVGTS